MPERQSVSLSPTPQHWDCCDLLLAADEGDLIWQPPSTLERQFEVSSSIVSARTCQADRLRSYMEAPRRQWLSSARCPKVLYWILDCSFDTLRTSQMWLPHTMLTSIPTSTTVNCIYSVTGRTWRKLLGDLKRVSWMWATGWCEETQAKRRQDWAALDWFQLWFCFTW